MPMATFNQLPRSFLFFLTLTLISEPISAFSLQGFYDDKNPDFYSEFALLNDAEIPNGDSSLNLTNPSVGSGYGQIVYKKPFKFLDSKSSKPISFSTDFTFLISPGHGDGLAFVIFPTGKLSKVFDHGLFGISEKNSSGFVAVEYDTRKDAKVDDINGNHIGVDVGSFESTVFSDVSSVGLALNDGLPLKTWIDYEASSKRLEIRLNESGSDRPYQPLISYPIDLSKMWGNKEVLVGISSSSGDSMQNTSISSWSFRIRNVPGSLHSDPFNPDDEINENQPKKQKYSCFLTVLGTLIFATGCGTLVAFFVLFLWVIIFSRHSHVTPELPLNSMDFKYEKVNVTGDNVSDHSTR